MEETKILLGSSKHKLGVNEDNFVGVELSSYSKVLPYTEDSYHIDAYSQYLKEKDEFDKFRFAFTITPFCTNVLFNMVTEPVYKEGSDDCIAVYYGEAASSNPFGGYNVRTLNTENAIRDTGYSHPKAGEFPLVYHCGYDIFNNHTLRKKEFNVVNSGNRGQDFNTINDALRNRSGGNVKEKILHVNQDGKLNMTDTNVHLYQYETIRSYSDSIYDNLIENNGWFGFLNVTTIPINNFGNFSINKCMNNNKAWEQIDMYPDRSLYSFVPKINKFRGRVERNWDYCLTYPFSADTEHEIITENGVNGIKCRIVSAITNDYLQDETELVQFKTFLRHNFVPGGYVTLSFVEGSQNERKTANPVKIVSVGRNGSDPDHYFSVRFSSIMNELAETVENGDEIVSLKTDFDDIRVRKYENGGEAQYYFRIFKKFDGNYVNSLNKLAFSQNIYSDQVAQIVFTDDIETMGLKDNLNRPISEVYLTIVKRNKGYESWYAGDVADEDVEFSHCFGEVTSGVDMPEDSECKDYNVRRIHSINDSDARTRGITVSPKKIEEGITIENDEFYGDIVEFLPSTMSETVIEPVYHRFNTAQREDTNGKYSGFTYDELIHDDYDIGETFEVEQKSFDNGKMVNLIPEGYYYKPHYKIQIRRFDDEVHQGSHITVNFSEKRSTGASGTVWNVKTSVNYYFQKGDTVYAYHVVDGKLVDTVIGECTNVEGSDYRNITIEFTDPVNLGNQEWRVFRENPIMPDYAYTLLDGTGRYLWRDVLSYTDMDVDDELYDEPFTNGAHYFHRNIMFYLKRQDPDGRYGIGDEPHDLAAWFQFSVNGKDKDVSYAEYVEEGGGTVC